ncbi:hypothetical protein Taro_039782 [Colocasia esculenta]|uniref:Uncharacterized protein n=1 Tax=Colocasia esculenta TaxID=4460 RepID=A0A843WN77_COLES|nr:hypothetical protein [Colocasia esculenta]
MANPSTEEAADDTTAAAPAAKASITHVIFDMDGLLLDMEGFYTLVQERILARYRKTFDWSLKAKMMGKKAIEAAWVFIDEMGLEGLLTPEGFLEEREDMLQELFPIAELMPVKKGKPSPDVFLAAAKRFEGNVDPSKVLVFEDAPSDQVLSSLLDFDPSSWGLPPFEDVESSA